MKKNSVEDIEDLIANLRAEIDHQETEKIRLISEYQFHCQSCKHDSKYSELVFKVSMYYVEPYSCTGGDYWKENEEKAVICPNCNILNRMIYKGKEEHRRLTKNVCAAYIIDYDYYILVRRGGEEKKLYKQHKPTIRFENGKEIFITNLSFVNY